MRSLFPPWINTVTKLALPMTVLALLGFFWFLDRVYSSPYYTREGVVVHQPVPFSHAHHVGGLGIDCRYCHTTVEEGPVAGLPSVSVCMNCHREIWPEGNLLEPIRNAYFTGEPIVWKRVYDLPDFVYFDHSIHVARGVGCSECHGAVDKMPLTYKAASLEMKWCLDCHRSHPESQQRTDCYSCHR